jgi:hypothetical protein
VGRLKAPQAPQIQSRVYHHLIHRFIVAELWKRFYMFHKMPYLKADETQHEARAKNA